MQLKFTTTYFSCRAGSRPGQQVIVAEDVVLDGTNDSREVLSQLDQHVVAEWLAEQGYIVTVAQENAA